MNKKIVANILFAICITLSIVVTYYAFHHASGEAVSGEQPSLLLGIGAFLVAVGLALAGVIAKSRVK